MPEIVAVGERQKQRWRQWQWMGREKAAERGVCYVTRSFSDDTKSDMHQRALNFFSSLPAEAAPHTRAPAATTNTG